MKSIILSVNILGIASLAYLILSKLTLADTVTQFRDSSDTYNTVLSLGACVGLLAMVTVVLVIISDIYWVARGSAR